MPTDDRGRFVPMPQMVLGLCAIAFGVLLTADNLGWLNAWRIIRFWPIVLVAVGLAVLLRPEPSGRLTGWLLLGAGVWLTAVFVYQLPFGVFDFWPLFIVAVGVAMLRQSRERAPSASSDSLEAPTMSAGPSATGGQTLSAFAFWSGVQRRVTSPAFRRADLAAVMGGIEVDLRQAGTAGGEAVIDVFALWGGIEITVPTDWDVANHIVVVMGGVEDKSSGMQGAKHRLVIRGFVLMGGVEVKT